MAWLKDTSGKAVYIFVESESLAEDIDISTHPVEEGIEFTDTVRRKAISISVSGKIVDYKDIETTEHVNPPFMGNAVFTTYVNGLAVQGNSKFTTIINKQVTKKASLTIETLKKWKNTGELLTYEGRNIGSSMQIASFSTDHTNKVWGGATFSMTLKECRIAKSAYVPVKENKSGGTQQVNKGENKEVYYTVKEGDCVAALVAEPNAPYKNLEREGVKKSANSSTYWRSCNWVMEKNPQAFSRKGDFKTLQIGKKILLGTRK